MSLRLPLFGNTWSAAETSVNEAENVLAQTKRRFWTKEKELGRTIARMDKIKQWSRNWEEKSKPSPTQTIRGKNWNEPPPPQPESPNGFFRTVAVCRVPPCGTRECRGAKPRGNLFRKFDLSWMVGPPRFELGLNSPQELVLPLHYGPILWNFGGQEGVRCFYAIARNYGNPKSQSLNSKQFLNFKL